MNAEIVLYLSALVAAGAAAGLTAGLFGVGGGLVIVPTLVFLLDGLGIERAVVAHVAVGTSLATIVATSWRSLAAHAKSGAVDGAVLRAWTPWIALGATLGAALAAVSDGAVLLGVFGVVALAIAAQIAFGDDQRRLGADLPGGLARAGLGGGLGLVSALMGIGGGALGVTLMTLFGRPIHQAVATASGFGAAVALPAAFGYALAGWGVAGLPFGSLGYVNLPGFAALALMTSLTAPLGARLAHRLPQQGLRRAFAAFLAVMALNILREAFAAGSA